MKDIPAGSVDLICTDLPFGITSCPFDKRIPFEPMWEQFLRVTKENAAILLFAAGKFLIELAASNLKHYRMKWVWEKSLAVGFLNSKKMPLRAHEDILVFYRKLPTYNPQFTRGKPYKHSGCKATHENYCALEYKTPSGSENGDRVPRDVIYYPSTVGQLPERLHPQQKPVELLEYLIKTYSNAGETVLDATCGSGSTGVACVNTGRKFIGFELDQNFFEIAQKRIAQAQAKKAQELF